MHLGAAARDGDIELLQQLIEKHGVEIEALDTVRAALHCIHNQRRQQHYSHMFSCASQAGGTALVQATAARQLEAATWLLQRGADVNATTEGGRSPLHIAAEAGADDLLQLLLAQGSKVKLNLQDRNGYAPLHVAAQAGQPDSCAALLGAGADVNLRAHEDKALGAETALMIAVRKLQPANRDKALRKAVPKVVQVLLEGGADTEPRGPMGDTVLDQARSMRDTPEGKAVYELLEDAVLSSDDDVSRSSSSASDS